MTGQKKRRSKRQKKRQSLCSDLIRGCKTTTDYSGAPLNAACLHKTTLVLPVMETTRPHMYLSESHTHTRAHAHTW